MARAVAVGIPDALTTLGIQPPAIDVWDFAARDGRMFTIESTGAAKLSS